MLLNARRLDHVQLILLGIRDITEMYAAGEALHEAKKVAEQANRAKSEFLANMSHEIRTPMTVFMAAIEHLLLIDRNPDRRHFLDMADASAKRLRALIDDILDFSRIEARKVQIDEEPFDIRQCAGEAVGMFTLPARKKNLALKMDVAAETPEEVVGDRNRLSQVLINLIGNAVKFTHEGEIRVLVQPRGSFLEFAVSDKGIGIPEEKHHMLFESFSQVDMSFHRQHGGSGLGLAISKGLVELMGGEISVQSREGEGSIFTFSLPLKTAAKTRSELPEAAPLKPDSRLAGLRILLAEDDPMIREMISMMLVKRGLKAETAETGRDALRKWEEGDFDLILMDLQMPEMNGMEATRSIREKEKEEGKRTCIIGLTAHTRREIKEECLASGMDHVLVKPVQMNDLFAVINDCVSG
jgi:CheY-like chemotaxis protein